MQLLVGGFPCQDYSVARTLNQAAGLVGKKGVLWWEIHRLLRDKHPPFGMFENVDRLLKSPATQRGRDFAVVLWTAKVHRNRERDWFQTFALKRSGWRVVRIWECALAKHPETCIRRIQRALE